MSALSADAVDERVLACLTKTRDILSADAKFVAQQTELTAGLVEAALVRLRGAAKVQVDAAGRWTLI